MARARFVGGARSPWYLHKGVTSLEIGSLIDDKYRLKREIARGGVGVVYEAEHRFTGRTVAIKVLTPEHAGVAESRDRLLLEARVLTIARHPGVVAALDAGQ